MSGVTRPIRSESTVLTESHGRFESFDVVDVTPLMSPPSLPRKQKPAEYLRRMNRNNHVKRWMGNVTFIQIDDAIGAHLMGIDQVSRVISLLARSTQSGRRSWPMASCFHPSSKNERFNFGRICCQRGDESQPKSGTQLFISFIDFMAPVRVVGSLLFLRAPWTRNERNPMEIQRRFDSHWPMHSPALLLALWLFVCFFLIVVTKSRRLALFGTHR